MTNNIPLNGWPQLKDLEAVQPTLDRLDKIEAWKRTVKEETFTGDDITIDGALALPARSLITEINAIQDLHGLPFPYVGGASKQLIPMTVANIKALNTGGTWSGNVYTVNGGTIEMLVDNADNIIGFKINGTFNTSTTNFRLVDKPAFDNVAYKISGAPANSAGKHIIQYSNFVDTAYQDTGSGADFTGQFDYTAYPNSRVVITVYPNITVNNVIIRPMICLASATDPTTFAPYSNICPISGRDSVVLTRSDGDEISEDFTIQLGQTVYGAEINWDTGVMTVISAKKVLTASDVIGVSGNQKRMNITISGVRNAASDSVADDIIQSDKFKAVSSTDTYSGTVGISVNTVGAIGIAIGEDLTLESAQQYVTANAIEVVYPLATPTTIQLTPTQLEMLNGYNRITLSDGYGTIELKALTGANWS